MFAVRERMFTHHELMFIAKTFHVAKIHFPIDSTKEFQAIRHISMQFIPEIWYFLQLCIPLQRQNINY